MKVESIWLALLVAMAFFAWSIAPQIDAWGEPEAAPVQRPTHECPPPLERRSVPT